RRVLLARGPARRPAVGGGADRDAAAADALPDPPAGAVLQPRLLLPGAKTRRSRALLLHENHGRQVLRARRHQDAVLVDVPDGARVRRALQWRRVPRAEAQVRPRGQRSDSVRQGRDAALSVRRRGLRVVYLRTDRRAAPARPSSRTVADLRRKPAPARFSLATRPPRPRSSPTSRAASRCD